MERLVIKCTPENRNNIGCGLIDEDFPECVFTTQNGYCGYHDCTNKKGIQELMNQLDRLGQMEDEAEQQEQEEKKCDWCGRGKQDCRNCSDCDGDFIYNKSCDSFIPNNYCGNCGRKLVE